MREQFGLSEVQWAEKRGFDFIAQLIKSNPVPTEKSSSKGRQVREAGTYGGHIRAHGVLEVRLSVFHVQFQLCMR